MLVESSQHVPPSEPASKKRKAAASGGGKWTEAEENYAAMIIAHFSNGKAPGLRGGESLRKLLADLLQCSPMRITKKFSRTRIVRKSSFKLLGELTAGEKAELDAARARFLAGDGKKAPKRRKDASHGGSGSGSGPWIFASTPPLDPSLHASIMPTAVTTTVYGYVTKEEKTFVRVVTMMAPALLQAFGAVCARHGVLLASYRLVTDEVGVAHVRMELESLAQPLPRWLLTAVEGDLKRELASAAASAAAAQRRPRGAAPPPPPAPPAEPPAAVSSLAAFVRDAALGEAPALRRSRPPRPAPAPAVDRPPEAPRADDVSLPSAPPLPVVSLPAAAPVLPMNPVVLPVLPVNPAPVSNAAVPELEDLGSPGTGLESYFASFIDVLKSDSFIVDVPAAYA
ncbi:SET domain-containing protein [Aureococcus anophagefferens]|nr:SET domain-containing protein [Aureococcus anophagefferens]